MKVAVTYDIARWTPKSAFCDTQGLPRWLYTRFPNSRDRHEQASTKNTPAGAGKTEGESSKHTLAPDRRLSVLQGALVLVGQTGFQLTMNVSAPNPLRHTVSVPDFIIPGQVFLTDRGFFPCGGIELLWRIGSQPSIVNSIQCVHPFGDEEILWQNVYTYPRVPWFILPVWIDESRYYGLKLVLRKSNCRERIQVGGYIYSWLEGPGSSSETLKPGSRGSEHRQHLRFDVSSFHDTVYHAGTIGTPILNNYKTWGEQNFRFIALTLSPVSRPDLDPATTTRASLLYGSIYPDFLTAKVEHRTSAR
ncbi:hypothetical protein EV421DRAFT_2021323 [Armillaria borealis]|uniref:Uncharacterized protein n=1 Tax=Armillaria borealis TaxID=47425 RepID=A0AA39JBX7_9AGAR|nr:hypothetical protein EV421DRAFT_2021323 [Armillaria borealis]